ncbi:putative plus-end-directed kinesin ATPase [Helianthus anomalus]
MIGEYTELLVLNCYIYKFCMILKLPISHRDNPILNICLDRYLIFYRNGEFPSDAGVIPRAVMQIFDILEAQNAEYNMKVTFLELYTEEITDLLAPEEASKFPEDKSKKPIALMEDGKGGVLVRGLEEEIVSTADEIYRIF